MLVSFESCPLSRMCSLDAGNLFGRCPLIFTSFGNLIFLHLFFPPSLCPFFPRFVPFSLAFSFFPSFCLCSLVLSFFPRFLSSFIFSFFFVSFSCHESQVWMGTGSIMTAPLSRHETSRETSCVMRAWNEVWNEHESSSLSRETSHVIRAWYADTTMLAPAIPTGKLTAATKQAQFL